MTAAAAALLPLLLLPLLFSVSPSAAQSAFGQICGKNSNFLPNSTYAKNLNAAAAAITANASSPGANLFASVATGAVPDRVYALGICRGDFNASACGACLSNGFADAQNLCPYDRQATVYYDPCTVSYSNSNFLSGDGTNNPNVMYAWNAVDVPADLVSQFTQLVIALVNATADYAAFNTTNRYAVSQLNGFRYTVNELAQCTPDLTPAGCRKCLGDEISNMPSWFGNGTQGGRILGVRCFLRFEIYSFFSSKPMLLKTQVELGVLPPSPPPLPPPTPAAAPASEPGKTSNTSTILAVAIPVGTALLVITGLLVCFCRKRKSRQTVQSYSSNAEDTMSAEQLIVDLATLRAATENFADHNKLGQGGFGSVYKGVLQDGQIIAVKRLSQSSGQGMNELKNELVLVAKLQHKNLVRLLGVCIEDQEKILVYEYIENRSLDTILFDMTKREQLTWSKRYKIINGIARGLQYLHEDSQLKIIHRDLKASNILLDAEMTPKISDFGMARLFAVEQTQDITNRVVGTFGYMAPEYAMRGQYSVKSDVFSFGVLVLEIVTGKKNSGSYDSDSDDLLTLVWDHWRASTVPEIVDPSMAENCSMNEAIRCVHIGMLCVQENPADRPNMSTVGIMLSSETVSLRSPAMPAFCLKKGNAATNTSVSSHDHAYYALVGARGDTDHEMASRNDVSISQLEPR